jgi:hypothetical protein
MLNSHGGTSTSLQFEFVGATPSSRMGGHRGEGVAPTETNQGEVATIISNRSERAAPTEVKAC